MFVFANSSKASNDDPPGVTTSPPQGLPAALIVGALVPPVLLGIMASRTLADILTQVGLVTEQLYRGERLPTLNMPPTETE